MLIEKSKIAGTVVLFNPEYSLISNIDSYIHNIDILFAIDNSEKPDHDLVNKINKYPQVIYISNEQNLGIAKALNIGAEKAIQKGYEWLLTMDQDSQFNNSYLFESFDHIHDIEKIAIISPYHFEDKTVDKQNLFAYDEVDIAMTSGNLINLSIFNTIGRFEEKLFIDEVDHDYCLRARMKGYKIITFKNIILNHKLGITKEIIRKGKKEIISEHSPSRMYYLTRNNLYLFKKYHTYYPDVVNLRMKNFLVLCRNILFYEDNKLAKVQNIVRGCLDFLRDKYGQ